MIRCMYRSRDRKKKASVRKILGLCNVLHVYDTYMVFKQKDQLYTHSIINYCKFLQNKTVLCPTRMPRKTKNIKRTLVKKV